MQMRYSGLAFTTTKTAFYPGQQLPLVPVFEPGQGAREPGTKAPRSLVPGQITGTKGSCGKVKTILRNLGLEPETSRLAHSFFTTPPTQHM